MIMGLLFFLAICLFLVFLEYPLVFVSIIGFPVLCFLVFLVWKGFQSAVYGINQIKNNLIQPSSKNATCAPLPPGLWAYESSTPESREVLKQVLKTTKFVEVDVYEEEAEANFLSRFELLSQKLADFLIELCLEIKLEIKGEKAPSPNKPKYCSFFILKNKSLVVKRRYAELRSLETLIRRSERRNPVFPALCGKRLKELYKEEENKHRHLTVFLPLWTYYDLQFDVSRYLEHMDFLRSHLRSHGHYEWVETDIPIGFHDNYPNEWLKEYLR
jgi:hypothetical protein